MLKCVSPKNRKELAVKILILAILVNGFACLARNTFEKASYKTIDLNF